MKVKVKHLKARKKITLYIPEEQAFIEEIVKFQKGRH